MKNQWLCLILLLVVSGCAKYLSKEPIHKLTLKLDPAKLTLEQGYNSYVQRIVLPEDEIETGIIKFKDGSSSKFWFRSHHFVDEIDGIGGTWFKMIDGKEKYMAGYFCCELQLPDEQLSSLKELTEFIKKHHGTSP
ncbi:MAG: hypothetical protein JRE40_13175 [Deltaproteobacteria bacterium]|nr:hypothetical protein [Deltaproteobacteria bacterium]